VKIIRDLIEDTSPLSLAGSLLAMAARTDTSCKLNEVKVPVLIMVGEHDKLTPPIAAQSMHEKFKDSEIHIIPDAAHMSNLENPDVFNEKLLAFLDKVNTK
jgi:pimeloyl-ACP methyl ester carboxylesterase